MPDSEHYNYRKIEMIPNNGVFFTDSVKDLKSGMFIPLNHAKVEVIGFEEKPIPLTTVLIKIVVGLFAILAMPFILVLPVLFVKLMMSVYKDEIFTVKNIKRLNYIGYIYIITSLVAVIIAYGAYLEQRAIVSLQDFHVTPPHLPGIFPMILIGIISLIIAKVIQKALIMKEEQELTI